MYHWTKYTLAQLMVIVGNCKHVFFCHMQANAELSNGNHFQVQLVKSSFIAGLKSIDDDDKVPWEAMFRNGNLYIR